MVRRLADEGRPATAAEQQVLARWSSWGALPEVFESWRPEWADVQSQVAQELTAAEHEAAAATTLNAHYTDPGIVRAIWDALEEAGVTQGTVLEPGCGAGTFIGMAPEQVRMVGVELDPLTARIASGLYPDAHIVASGFQDAPLGAADAQPSPCTTRWTIRWACRSTTTSSPRRCVA